jgi:hypothetical protein
MTFIEGISRISELEKQNRCLLTNLEGANSLIIEYEEEMMADAKEAPQRTLDFEHEEYFRTNGQNNMDESDIHLPQSLPKNLIDTLICPITHEIMRNPWMDYEGHSYELNSILTHLKKNKTSPITRSPMDATPEFLFPNIGLRNTIQSLKLDMIPTTPNYKE